MIHIIGLTKWFGRQCLLKNIDLTLKRGEIVGLTGPSGAGKSVLLKILGGVMDYDGGEIKYSEGKTQNSVGFLFQAGALFDSQSVLENVSFPLLNNDGLYPGMSEETANEWAVDILSEVGLRDAVLKHPGQLSGGMRRRVALARALVHKPELVLLDDPTGGLDPVAASVIMKLICSLHEQYQPTILMVSHDIRRLLPTVDRTIALFDGRIVYDGPTSQIYQSAPKQVSAFLATRYDFEESRN